MKSTSRFPTSSIRALIMSHSRRGHLYSFTWVGKSVLLVLIALTVLSGCGTPPPPPPTPTPTPNPPPSASNPMPLVPVVNSPNIGGTQIWFLLDNSGSVVGSERSFKGCKELGRDARPEFIEYVRKIFTDFVTPQDQQYLLRGIGVFGDEYHTLDWDSPRIPSLDDDTYYAAGIRDAIDGKDGLYKKGNARRRFLVVITDGAFTSETVENVQAELQGQIKAHNELSIYVALLCPDDPSLKDDVEEWRSQIDTLDNVEVFFGVEDVAKRIFDDLESQRFFPAGSKGVIVLPQDNIVVPGYFTSAVFLYWSTDPNNDLFVEDYTTGDQETFSPGNVHTFHPITKNGCPNSEFAVSNNGLSKGLVFINPQTFKSLRFFFEPFQNGKLEIVNFAPISVKLNVFDDQSDNFGKWNDCFKVSLVTQDDKPLEVDDQPCNAMGNMNMCSELQWNPLQIKDNQSAGIKVKLSTLDGNIWESAVIDVPIMFQASFDPQNNVSPTPTDRIDSYFSFSNVVVQPHVYLVSVLTPEEYDAVGKVLPEREACPTVTPDTNNQLASEIIIRNDNSCPPQLLLPGNQILTNMCGKELNPRQYQYDVATYRYVVEQCGYKEVLFTWQDSGNAKAITWMCDVLGNTGCVTPHSP